jgi:radical SAM protein with 4Fe4S-binding SPASM domain
MKKINRENICPTPFTTLILNPNGDVGCCRQLTNHHVIGNIFKESLEDIWNGEKVRLWRKEFLEGKISTCSECMEFRHCHLGGENNALYDHTDFSEVQKRPPLRLSPDFNGQCNLTCNMCDIWTLPNGLYDENEIWPILEKNLFPFLTIMEPLGGEPFVQKDTFRLIKLMSEINPTCKWSFTTNAHWQLNKSIKKHLDLLQEVDIRVSLDGLTEDVFKKIRGGDLSLVLQTVEDLHQYNQERMERGAVPMKISLAMTVQTYNWKEMHLFAMYGDQEKFHDFHYQETVGGEEYKGGEILILNQLPEIEKIRITEYILDSLKPKAMFKAKEVLFPILKTLDKEKAINYQKEFYKKSLMKLEF